MKHTRILWLVAASLWLAWGALPSTAHAQDMYPPDSGYYVGLNNGRLIYTTSINFRERAFGADYLILGGRDQVVLDDVKFLRNEEGFFIYEAVENSRSRQLLRREFIGDISLFSTTELVYTNNNFNPYSNIPNTGSVQQKTNYYLRKGPKGPVMRFTYRNVRDAVADHPASLEIMQQVQRKRWFAGGFYAAGLVMLLNGIEVYEYRDPAGNPIRGTRATIWLPLGVATLIAPVFFNRDRNERMEEAILLYNRRNEAPGNR